MSNEEIKAAMLASENGTGGNDDSAAKLAEQQKQAADLDAAKQAEIAASAAKEAEAETAKQQAAEAAKKAAEGAQVKSFDEDLVERTKGKYKTWGELEKDLNAPKPETVEFANEKIKHFNELAKKGVDVTSKEFLELQSLDVDKADPLFEKWKRSDDGKGLSDSTIKHEIRKKYNVAEWEGKEAEDLTEDDLANREKMQRDISQSKEWLTAYKNERVLEKQVDPKLKETQEKEAQAFQENWENEVEESTKDITKLSTPLNDKGEKFEYEISAETKARVVAQIKALTKDASVPFSQFLEVDKEGNKKWNQSAMTRMLLKAENYDKAVALSYSDGVAKEKLRSEKESKNTDFSAQQTGNEGKVFVSVRDSLAKAVKAQKD